MKKLITLLLLFSVSTIHGQFPGLLNRMIEKYPSAYRRVWYYYDVNNGMEYYRTQFQSSRDEMQPADINELKRAYLNEWNVTDFQNTTGTQYRSPDSLSLTLRSADIISFDLGPRIMAADWGREVKSRAKAQKPTFAKLEKTFDSMQKKYKSKVEKVSYTGFPQGILFVFHRGKGRGMTSGNRITLYGVPLSEYEKLRSIIRSYIGQPMPVTVFDRTWMVMVKNETTPDFYTVGYDPVKKTLNFLHATVEDEICIPYDWQTINKLPK